jgi:methionyl-tRNA synthetase
VARVQEVLERVHDNGHVYKGTYEGRYCPRCADFKTEAELVDGNKCPIHKIELEWETEENYFFRLSSFQEPLERLYAERPEWIRPRNRYNEALSFIQQGLNDISLTRARITWGVPVPWDDAHVFYVWFDALLNYYTALSFARDGEDLTDRFWPATVHVIGKDILKFHAVFWPALLMAADVEVPESEYVHGYLLADEHKMSKSLGNVIDPFQVIETYGNDALRYYLFAAVGFGQDGNVSPADFEVRYTTELANQYGNLASRTLAMVQRYRDGVVPEAALAEGFPRDLDDLAERVCARFDEVNLTAALGDVWALVRKLNQYVQDEQPWQLAKDPANDERLDSVLYTLAEGLRVVSVLVHAFLPDSAGKLLEALGQEDLDPAKAHLGDIGGGATIGELEPLFPKVEQAAA